MPRRWVIPLGPAKDHFSSSSLASNKVPAKFGDAHQRFLCSQIIQAPRIILELSPLRVWLSIKDSVLSHQSSKQTSSICGVRACRPSFCSSRNQNSCEKGQAQSKWLINSSFYCKVDSEEHVVDLAVLNYRQSSTCYEPPTTWKNDFFLEPMTSKSSPLVWKE